MSFTFNPFTKKLDAKHKDASIVHLNGNGGAAATINWANGNEQAITLTADCTLTFTNPKTPQMFRLITTQDVGGGHAISWPAGTMSVGGVKPAPTAAGGSVDMFDVFWDGTNYIVDLVMADIKTIV